MDPEWCKLQELEAQIKEHNTAIEFLSPSRKNEQNMSSPADLKRALSFWNSQSPEQNGIYLKKRVQDLEREISYLQKDLISLEMYKEQHVNMQKQMKFMRDKLSHYESELNDKALLMEHQDSRRSSYCKEKEDLLSNLQGKLQGMQISLEQKDSLIASLQLETSNAASKHEESETHRQSLKKKCIDFHKELKETKQEINRAEELMYEKEQIVSALEEDNERLRDELTKAMDSLQKCQIEISYIPQLRKDLHMNETYLANVEKELEQGRKDKSDLHAEKEKTDAFLRNLKRVTKGKNPVEFIEDLHEQLTKTTFELASIGDQVSTVEARQKKHDLDVIRNMEGLSGFLERLVLFIDNDFYNEGIPVFPRMDNDLAEKFHVFYLSFSKKHREVLAYFTEMSNLNNELTGKLEQYESLIAQFKGKQDEIVNHLNEQENITHSLQIEKQNAERKLSDTHKELEKHSSALQKFDKLLDAYNSENNTSSVETTKILIEKLEKTSDKLGNFSNAYRHLQEKYADLEASCESQTEQFEKYSRHYSNKIEYLKEDLEQMTVVLRKNEKNMKEIVDSYNLLISQHTRLRNDHEQLTETHKAILQQKANDSIFIAELAQVFFPVLMQRNNLIAQKRYCLVMLNHYEVQLSCIGKKFSSFSKPTLRSSISRFRSVAITVICTIRLRKRAGNHIKDPNTGLLSLSLPISLPSIQSCTRETFLFKLLKKNNEYVNLGISNLIPSPMSFLDFFDELSKELLKYRELQEEARDRQSELQSFKQYVTELLTQLEDSSTMQTNFSESKQTELEGYTRLIRDLQESSFQLQNCLETVKTQRDEYQHDNDEKTMRIEYLQRVIDHLNVCVTKNTPDSMQAEISNLSDLLRKFMVGYTTLERKLEENQVYVEEMIQELKKKNRTIKAAEKKLAHYRELLGRDPQKCEES